MSAAEDLNAPVYWRCDCGHPLYEHGRRVLPGAGGLQEYTGCRIKDCLCALYAASDRSGWPERGQAGGVPLA